MFVWYDVRALLDSLFRGVFCRPMSCLEYATLLSGCQRRRPTTRLFVLWHTLVTTFNIYIYVGVLDERLSLPSALFFMRWVPDHERHRSEFCCYLCFGFIRNRCYRTSHTRDRYTLRRSESLSEQHPRPELLSVVVEQQGRSPHQSRLGRTRQFLLITLRAVNEGSCNEGMLTTRTREVELWTQEG